MEECPGMLSGELFSLTFVFFFFFSLASLSLSHLSLSLLSLYFLSCLIFVWHENFYSLPKLIPVNPLNIYSVNTFTNPFLKKFSISY